MNAIVRKLLLPLAALLLLLAMIAWMAGVFAPRIAPGLAPLSGVEGDDLHTVQRRVEPVFEPVPASVEARETTVIAARLLARITALPVRAGDQVAAGDLLVQLEDAELLARERQAEEQVRSVRARLREAEQSYTRARELNERQLMSDADLDAARASFAELEAALAAAEQGLQEAQTALGYAQIRAPIAGRVVDRFAEPGDTVSPGQKILSIYNPYSLRVEAWVREGLALDLAEGQTLRVEIPAAGRMLEASIEEIVPAANPGSRAFLIKAILPAEGALLPGLYARVQVPAGTRERLLIPRDRVAEIGQLDLVWVEGEQGSSRRFVRLGETRADGWVEVLGGVSEGESLALPPIDTGL